MPEPSHTHQGGSAKHGVFEGCYEQTAILKAHEGSRNYLDGHSKERHEASIALVWKFVKEEEANSSFLLAQRVTAALKPKAANVVLTEIIDELRFLS